LIVAAIALLGMGSATAGWQVLFWRGVWGVGEGVTITAAYELVYRAAALAERDSGTVMGWFGSMATGGMALGVLGTGFAAKQVTIFLQGFAARGSTAAKPGRTYGHLLSWCHAAPAPRHAPRPARPAPQGPAPRPARRDPRSGSRADTRTARARRSCGQRSGVHAEVFSTSCTGHRGALSCTGREARRRCGQ